MIVGIAGIGGIGSNVAVHLVRSGLTHIKIVDFDTVGRSNLNRQFYFEDQIGRPKTEMLAVNLKRINPGVAVEPIACRLNPENLLAVFADCGVVVEGFDQRHAKKWFVETLGVTGKFLVSACGIAGSKSDHIHCRRIGNCTIVGDFVSDCRDHRLYSHKVALIAARMAGVIVEEGGFNAGVQ